jgi:large subunit ribosomal protein L19
MALNITFGDTQFSVGDRIKVSQRIKEGDKSRTQIFEGIVLSIKGRGNNKMFTVRKIGAAGIGVERIFPLGATTIEKIDVVKKVQGGVRRAKLYYVRTKSPKEIEKIYSRKAVPVKKTSSKRKTSKKS